MVELPPLVGWIGDDFPFFWGGCLPAEVGGGFLPLSSFDAALESWVEEFNHTHEIGAMFLFCNHPRCIGFPSRLRVVEKVIRHVRATPNVWFTTQMAVADWVQKVL